MIKLLHALVFCLLLNPLFANNLVTVYGLENGRFFNGSRAGGAQYQVQIGAFRSEANAIKCKNQYHSKTSSPIRIIANKVRGNYLVIMGPFTDPGQLKTVSNALLSGKIPVTQQIVQKPIQPKKAVVKSKALKPVVRTPERQQPQKTAAVMPAQPAIEARKTVLPPKTNKSTITQGLSTPIQKVERPAAIPKKQLIDKQILPESQVLLDDQAIQANQISQVMRTTGKMSLKSENERKTIENRMWELKTEAADLEAKLKTETDGKKIAALKKRKNVIDNELDKIVNNVIQRITLR